MKVFFLADGNSAHTINWIKYLSASGVKIFLFSLTSFDISILGEIGFMTAGLNPGTNSSHTDISKIGYIKTIRKIKKALKEFKPDILHAHYATSYGFLGVLSHFRPFVLSVWGSDIYSFPRKSFIHKALLKFNLKHADAILSTSNAMATETRLYTDKEITVTPFGIDTEIFTSKNVISVFGKESIVIGTVKTIDRIYGIEYLIRAFILLKPKYNNLKLLLVGGYNKNDVYITFLKQLIKENDIIDDVVFTGKIPHNEISEYHNMLDIPVYVSLRESFGVSVLESQACQKAVVISNTGGLPETVQESITGFIVPPGDEKSTAEAIEILILDEKMRKQMGKNAREWVIGKYGKANVTKAMLNIYSSILLH